MLISTLGNRMVSGWQEILECVHTQVCVSPDSFHPPSLNYYTLTRSAVGRKEKKKRLKRDSSAEGRRQLSGLSAVLVVPRVPDPSSPQRLVLLSAFGLRPSGRLNLGVSGEVGGWVAPDSSRKG